MLAAIGRPVPLVRKMGEVRVTVGTANHHASPMAPVAAVGPTPRRVFLPAKAAAPVAPSSSSHENRDAIDEHGILTTV
jgi:hypothetical protein